jgi:oligopeptide transport system ATP-binding protein
MSVPVSSNSSAASTDTLLNVQDLVKHFPIKKGVLRRTETGSIKAVDGISFRIDAGETLGLVGESGCGKSTTGRVLLGLEEATSGHVYYYRTDVGSLSKSEIRALKRNMQMIFQDPYASLNPRMTIESIIVEPLEIHHIGTRRERKERVTELLLKVGLDPKCASRYPNEFSGGQRQRIGIARAIALNPKFIVCDEPVSALDVSVQAGIVNLLQDLQEEYGLSYLFIAHDLSVVRHISNRVAVMYLGKIVEMAKKGDLYSNPLHPYTQALLSSIPVPSLTIKQNRVVLEGDVPSPIDPPPGCRFHPRCTRCTDICREESPPNLDVGGHEVWCHLYG